MMAASTIVEIEPTQVVDTHGDGSQSTLIRNFRLTMDTGGGEGGGGDGGFTVELSSLGASITKILMPNYANNIDNDGGGSSRSDDVVLSYASPLEQYHDRNVPYFGCIVGRVANRIRRGRFDLDQCHLGQTKTISYQLDRNNGPHHLHGGHDGFGHRVWEAEIVEEEEEGEEEGRAVVRFTLTSPDGDQGYPGGIKVVAEYSLVEAQAKGEEKPCGVKLCLSMRASLLPDETSSTPISLANHCYFNLAGHAHRAGVLDHVLAMPNCHGYTPVDDTLIPTRAVQSVDVDTCMDFRMEKCVGDFLVQYGREKVGLSPKDATDNVMRRQASGGAAHVARAVSKEDDGNGSDMNSKSSDCEGEPYGFDHNYAIDHWSACADGSNSLTLAAILSHPPTLRSLQVFTTAPGVQLYTSNYLDGNTPIPQLCKEGKRYGQWQGICLETQSYPDSIYRNEKAIPEKEMEFAKGRCFILRPEGEEYSHCVEYVFGKMR